MSASKCPRPSQLFRSVACSKTLTRRELRRMPMPAMSKCRHIGNTLTPNFKNILVTLAHLCWEHHVYDHTTWNYSVAAWDEKTGPKSVVVLEYALKMCNSFGKNSRVKCWSLADNWKWKRKEMNQRYKRDWKNSHCLMRTMLDVCYYLCKLFLNNN